MAFCIPKNLVKRLKEAASRGELNIKDLYAMSSDARRAKFALYVDQTTAQGINAGFENAMASSQRTALSNWVNDTFVGKAKAKKTDVIDKIVALKEKGLLNSTTETNFLGDLITDRLGVRVSRIEAAEIARRADILTKLYEQPRNKFGSPPTEYFVEKQKMEKYLQSLNPTHNIKVLTSVAGRGALLFSLKSPIVNIIGNTVQAIEQSMEKRIASGQYAGKVDKNVVKEYMKISKEIYNSGHFDLSRADSYSEGAKTLGEMITHSQGKGVARRLGRFYEDVVFNTLLGKPDVTFARALFVDSANLFATKIARSEGLTGDALKARATELFMDAATPGATTPEGMLIREEARADALFGTFQNDSTLSQVSLGIRQLINKASGDVTLGDQILPFVKTPANVVSMSLDAGGLGVVKGTWGLLRGAVTEFKQGNPAPMRNVSKNFVRAGMGMTIAFILSALVDPDDFVGMYPTNPSEQELLKSKNGNGNMIRVGKKWVSLDYFGFLGGALVGFLYAKKYGKGFLDTLYSYAAGVLIQTAQIPGIEETKGLTTSLLALRPDEYESFSTKTKKSLVGTLDQIRARVVPLSADLAKAFDTVEREVDPTSMTDKIKAVVPGLRNTLPAKTDVFGNIIKGEPWWSVVLFGARVKTAVQTEVTEEFTRLNDAGFLPTLSRPEKTSTRVQELKVQVGDIQFAKAMESFRSDYYNRTIKEIRSSSYKRMTDEEKKSAIDSIKSDSLDRMLTRYHYRKPRK